MKSLVLPYCTKFFGFENQDLNHMRYIGLADSADSQEIYSDESVIIRDVKDMSKKETYRQLIKKSAPNEVESEIKLFNVNEMDAKSSSYTPVKTSKNVKNKKQKTCVDTNNIISHYVRVALSAMHFMDCTEWEKKPLEILILGASVGLFPYFIKKIFKQYVNVTAVEENDKLRNLGREYFGFENDDINYVNNTGVKFLQSKQDHNKSVIAAEKENKKHKKKIQKYDLIIINEMNFGNGMQVSPSQDYLKHKNLLEIRVRQCLII